MQKMFKIRRV